MVAYDKNQVTLHLCKNGFVPGYDEWHFHGESHSRVSTQMEVDDGEDVDRLDQMLDDLQPEFNLDREDPPTKEVQELFELLQALEYPLHGQTTVTVLQFVTHLMGIKSKFAFSGNCYKAIVDLICDVLLADHKVPKDMYRSKKLLKALGMPYERIDVCPDNSMLFWKDREKEEKYFKGAIDMSLLIRWSRCITRHIHALSLVRRRLCTKPTPMSGCFSILMRCSKKKSCHPLLI